MRPYEAYLTMQKQANMLTHGLWKGTALGAVPGALAGGAAGYNMSEDHPYLAAAGGALAAGAVGGVLGRGAHEFYRGARMGLRAAQKDRDLVDVLRRAGATPHAPGRTFDSQLDDVITRAKQAPPNESPEALIKRLQS